MNKEIKYNGYSAQPSDYECQDGDLALSLNLVNEDGRIKGLQSPISVMESSKSNSALFIHKTASFTNYICYDSSTSKLTWKGNGNKSGEVGTVYNILHCNAIGNTLIVFCKLAMYYFLWKNDNYISLGDHIPNIQLSFGLVGHPRLFSKSDSSKKKFTVSFEEGIEESKIREEFSEKNRNKITEQIMAKVNKFISDQTINKGRFCFPFFVRYALRMYDGSIIAHSAPILMNPQTKSAPIVLWERVTGKGKYTDATCDIMLMACDIDYQVIYNTDFQKLDNWTDLITSVDVFISKPLYTYDQNGTINSLHDVDNFESVFIGKLCHTRFHRGGYIDFAKEVTEDEVLKPMASNQTDDFVKCYAEWPYSRIYQLYFDRNYPGETFHMPEFSEEKNGESVRNCAQFYLLRSIPINELKDNADKRTVIDVTDEYLQSLVTREAMTDDYLSRDYISATDSQVYNSRLNLSGVKRKPFAGFSPTSMFAFTDKYISTWSFNNDNNEIHVAPSPSSDSVSIAIYLQDGDKVFRLDTSGSAGAYLSPSLLVNDVEKLQKRSTGCFIFYPNVKATHAAIYSSVIKNPDAAYGFGGTMVVKLKPHEFLNGSYALLDYDQIREINYTTNSVPTVTASPYGDSAWIDCGNKVYTSEVNNPFYFPVTGINTIGTGKILGIATAAKALSQGQFGQFPLYAFTEDGVWAMEVSSTGSFSAKQPITRDVCINPDGITQIDSAVLFPTNRGIMLISGSNVQCLSDIINTNTPFEVCPTLPQMDKLHQMMGEKHQLYDADGNAIAWDSCIPTQPFLEFLKDCRMIYDYVHQRIIVYNTNYTYAYVYAMKSQQWGMIHSDIKSNLNSYPEALAVTKSGKLVDFSLDGGSPLPGLLVTRPLKLDNANVLKTVDTIIQRGNFRKGHVQSVLYGSRDLVNWHLVWSSKDHYLRGFRGTPYKYYRIALLCNLNRNESIFGASVQFTPKLINQPR